MTACRRSWPTSCAVAWPFSLRPAATLLPRRPKLRARRFRSSSVLARDPVKLGLVASLARPGGNATGFLMFEYGIAAKWLELLKEISLGEKRVAVLREPTMAGIGQLAAMQTASPSFGVELHPIDVSDAGEIERALADFARAPTGGLIVPLSTSAISYRKLIVALADRHQLPAIYPSRLDAAVGGLISYGPNGIDTYRRVAGYAGRILKGEKPADLPVRRRPSSSWSSISRPPRRSASKFHRHCSPAPTR